MTQPFKICPKCQTSAEMSAAFCLNCGRQYLTTAPQGSTVAPAPVYAAPITSAAPWPVQSPVHVRRWPIVAVPVALLVVVVGLVAWLALSRLAAPSAVGTWESERGDIAILSADKRLQANFFAYGYNHAVSFEHCDFRGSWSITGNTLNMISDPSKSGNSGYSNSVQYELSTDGKYLHLYIGQSATMLLHRVTREELIADSDKRAAESQRQQRELEEAHRRYEEGTRHGIY